MSEKQGTMWQSLPNAPGVYLMKASDGFPNNVEKYVSFTAFLIKPL